MRKSVRIEAIDNGYLLELRDLEEQREAYPTLDAVLERLLSYFEWRSATGSRESYGRVIVQRECLPKPMRADSSGSMTMPHISLESLEE